MWQKERESATSSAPRWLVGVQSGTHFLARLEIRDSLTRYINSCASAGIAPLAGISLTRGKCAKTAEFDTSASSEARCNLIEEGIECALHITGAQIGIILCQCL